MYDGVLKIQGTKKEEIVNVEVENLAHSALEPFGAGLPWGMVRRR